MLRKALLRYMTRRCWDVCYKSILYFIRNVTTETNRCWKCINTIKQVNHLFSYEKEKFLQQLEIDQMIGNLLKI